MINPIVMFGRSTSVALKSRLLAKRYFKSHQIATYNSDHRIASLLEALSSFFACFPINFPAITGSIRQNTRSQTMFT
jgi:hypothetical protein